MTSWLEGAPFIAAAIAAFVILGYEGLALGLGLPTISQVTAGQVDGHPHLAVVGAFVAGVLATLLLGHFSGVLPWWRP